MRLEDVRRVGDGRARAQEVCMDEWGFEPKKEDEDDWDEEGDEDEEEEDDDEEEW